MALDVGNRFAEAERAYEWLRAMQHDDGSWHAYYVGDDGEGAHARHQRHLLRRERRVAPLPLHPRHRLPRRDVPGRRARDRLRARQPAPDRRDRVGRRSRSASTARARCSPDRRASTRRCAARSPPPSGSAANAPTGSCRSARSPIAIAHRPERFLDKDRWAMDWYYPILVGVLRGHAAEARARGEVGHVRRAGPRRALRLRPAVGHRGRDVRARHGARRDRPARPRPRRCSRGCSSCATTTARTGPA